MKLVPLTDVAPLVADRVQLFDDTRPYIATGGLDDDGNLYPDMVTYVTRPSRADLCVLPGDVCMARMQATLKVFRFGATHSKLILSTGFAVFRPVPEWLDSRYLFHYLRTDRLQDAKDALCSGATQKAITNEKITTLGIPLPSLPEQRRVAEVLDRAEALRAKRRAALAQLATLTQAIFLNLFGDPNENRNRWEIVPLGEVCVKLVDGTHKTPTYTASGVPFITVKNIVTGTLDFEATKFISEHEHTILTRRVKPERGDILVSKDGTIGVACPVETERDFSIFVSVALLKIKHEVVEQFFLTGQFRTDWIQSQILAGTKGIAIRHLHLNDFKRLRIILPPLSLQKEYVRRVAAVEKLKTAYRSSLEALDALFVSLQHRAFRGES